MFCDPESFSPSRRLKLSSISAQLEAGIERLSARYAADGFVAYFQPATNTYAPVDRLRSVFEETISHPKVVGLAIGTRPDCVPDDVLDLLAELSKRTYLVMEYGLQSIHEQSLKWMKRGHDFQAFWNAYKRSRKRNLQVGVHVILGLPGETSEDMLATARELASLELHSIKLHNLYAVRNTPLADMVARGEVELPGFDDYVNRVVDFLELLPPECVIDRLSGDAPPEYLVGPHWCLDKRAIRAAVEAEFRRARHMPGGRLGLGTLVPSAQPQTVLRRNSSFLLPFPLVSPPCILYGFGVDWMIAGRYSAGRHIGPTTSFGERKSGLRRTW